MLGLLPAEIAPPPAVVAPPSNAGGAASIRADAVQLQGVCDFTDSLLRQLEAAAQGTPDRALMRELLSRGLRRALDLVGPEAMRRFLDVLSVNIHKFPLQEQQSLARVYHVEISSEYQNLESFVQDSTSFEADDYGPLASLESPQQLTLPDLPPASGDAVSSRALLEEVRSSLRCLPPQPSLDGCSMQTDEVLERITDDEEFAAALQSAEPAALAGFYSDLRLNLFRFDDASQRQLVEHFPELRGEIVRLVDSLAQEVSRWLDEESAARAGARSAALAPHLLGKLRSLFQAVLSAPFLAAFRHLGPAEKRGKETFLLKVALCLRTCAEEGFEGCAEDASKLRMHFFYVEGYGELMEDWLQNRIRQFNEDFLHRASSVVGSNLGGVMARLRRTLRPGRWIYLLDPQLEDDLFTLFLDASFPRHVLTVDSIGKLLRKISLAGGDDFHIYNNIGRASPQQPPAAPMGLDSTENALRDLLQRYPPFPSLQKLGPGMYLFGSTQVELLLRGPTLWARLTTGGEVDEMPADEFFTAYGPIMYPAAADLAAQQSPQGSMTTTIIAQGVSGLPALEAPPLSQPLPAWGMMATSGPGDPVPAPCAGPVRGGLTSVGVRPEPYPTVTPPVLLAPPASLTLGVEDEEI